MVSGQWAVGSGAVGSGQWAVGSGQWAVGSGQWAVGSGQCQCRAYGTLSVVCFKQRVLLLPHDETSALCVTGHVLLRRMEHNYRLAVASCLAMTGLLLRYFKVY